MIPYVLQAFGTTAVTAASGQGTLGALIPAMLVLTVVALVVGGLRQKALQTEHTRVVGELQSRSNALRIEREQAQKLRADHEEKQREVQELRREAGAQRKKNHSMQDEVKKLRASVKEETERRIAAQNTRPAFAEPAAPKSVAPEPRREAASPAREAAATAAIPAARPAAVAAPGPSELALQVQIKTLEAELGRHKQTMDDERTRTAGLKDELKKLRKRSEDLRRIDIITKSKMEILEDKLRHLGRAHYEAISEVALLKGEVQPPRPREVVRPEGLFGAASATEDLDDTNTTDDPDFAAENASDADAEAAPHRLHAPASHDAASVAQPASLL